MQRINFQENIIFSGLVTHTRIHPFEHTFNYKVNYFWFRVDEFETYKLFKKNKFSLFSFFDKDHGPIENKGDIVDYFKKNVGKKVIEFSFVKAFCLPRILGYNFNPISIFICYDSKKKPHTIIFEVNNTFNERHLYACRVSKNKNIFNLKKRFYVSPFFNVKGDYKILFKIDDKKINLIIDYYLNKKKVFNASFNGTSRKMNDKNLLNIFLTSFIQNIKVTIAIYIQALKLVTKGAKYIKRPKFSKTVLSKINDQ